MQLKVKTEVMCWSMVSNERREMVWDFSSVEITIYKLKEVDVTNFHYEKSCPQILDWHATRLSQKLLCNQGTIIVWKYDELIIKMPHQDISQL